MAQQDAVKQALDVIPGAEGLVDIVGQAAAQVKLNPTHLIRVAATQIRLNPKLAKCTPASFIGSLIALEQVGLEPVAGRAYLIPFLNNRKINVNGREEWRKQLEVQLVIGYQGYSDLFYRHESSLTIEMHTRHEKDTFSYEYGTDSHLRHKPAEGERGPAIGYYAVAKMKGGASLFKYMSKDECLKHGVKHSKVYDKRNGKFFDNSPWAKDEDAMCMKTVFLQLKKVLPLSIETQKALSIDETSRDYRSGIKSALDLPDTTDWKDGAIDVKPETVKTILPADETLKTGAITNGKIPPNVVTAINKLKDKVGEKVFFRVLGDAGCTTVEEISNIEEANKIISAMDKAYAASQEA